MKLKIIWIVIFSVISLGSVYWACEYTSEIKECSSANSDHTTREIENFICIETNPEIFTYQIILDAKFKEIDERIEDFISQLEENKWYYFWKDKQESYLDAVNTIVEIYSQKWDFGQEYYNACNGITKEVLTCKGDSSLDNIFWTGSSSVSITSAKDYFWDEPTLCTQLADEKLAIYKKVSYDILLLNKLQVSRDEKKLYVQEERSKYDGLLSKIMINLWYVERIWAKWPAKIKNISWS